MDCPRCGFSEPGPVECPRCGIVFARLDRPARPAQVAPVEPAFSSTGSRISWLDFGLLVGLAASGTVIWSRWAHPPPAHRDDPAVTARVQPEPITRAPSVQDREIPLYPPSTVAMPGFEPSPPGLPPSTLAGSVPALAPEDAALYQSLTQVVRARNEIESSHIEQAEALNARHPDAGRILEQVLELAAQQAAKRGPPA